MKVRRKFTPAPWSFEGHTVFGGTPPKKAQHAWKTGVCSLPMTDMVTGLLSPQEREANGRLIQVAPDMFNIIEQSYDTLSDELKKKVDEVFKRI